MKKEQKNKNLIGILYMIYFFGTVILLMFNGNTNQVPFIFGQLFFVSAMIFLAEPDKTILCVLAHLTIGLIAIDIIPILKIPKAIYTDLSFKHYLIFVVFLITIFLGYFFIIKHKFTDDKKKQKVLYISSWLSYIASFVILYVFAGQYLF